MLQTLMVKLNPNKKQYQILLDTMHRFNEACNAIAEVAFAMRKANKVELHKVVYYDIRERFGLSAQLTIRAISKVAEAYKRDKSIKPEFRLDGPSDYIAAMNIASRAEVRQPIVSEHSILQGQASPL